MNKGFLTEYIFIDNLGKKFNEINLFLQELVESLLSWNKRLGDKNSVHLELISKIIKYLERFNFKETEKLLRYLCSDGISNNTGLKRVFAKRPSRRNY